MTKIDKKHQNLRLKITIFEDLKKIFRYSRSNEKRGPKKVQKSMKTKAKNHQKTTFFGKFNKKPSNLGIVKKDPKVQNGFFNENRPSAPPHDFRNPWQNTLIDRSFPIVVQHFSTKHRLKNRPKIVKKSKKSGTKIIDRADFLTPHF